jgi:hypothetical protein
MILATKITDKVVPTLALHVQAELNWRNKAQQTCIQLFSLHQHAMARQLFHAEVKIISAKVDEINRTSLCFTNIVKCNNSHLSGCISEFEYNRSIKFMYLNPCVGIDLTIIPQSTQDTNKFQRPHRRLFHNSYDGTSPIQPMATHCMQKVTVPYCQQQDEDVFISHVPSFHMYRGTQRPIAKVQGQWLQQS